MALGDNLKKKKLIPHKEDSNKQAVKSKKEAKPSVKDTTRKTQPKKTSLSKSTKKNDEKLIQQQAPTFEKKNSHL